MCNKYSKFIWAQPKKKFNMGNVLLKESFTILNLLLLIHLFVFKGLCKKYIITNYLIKMMKGSLNESRINELD